MRGKKWVRALILFSMRKARQDRTKYRTGFE